MTRTGLKIIGNRIRQPWGTLWRDRRGAAAVEFALIAAPFLMMLMACFELALVVIMSVSLDIATDKAAREIRTGITTATTTQEEFKQKICDNMGWLGASCVGNLNIDVRTFNSFAETANVESVIVDGDFDPARLRWQIGEGTRIQLVRAYYKWPTFTPFLERGTTSLSSGDTVLSTKVVFRNEPF